LARGKKGKKGVFISRWGGERKIGKEVFRRSEGFREKGRKKGGKTSSLQGKGVREFEEGGSTSY